MTSQGLLETKTRFSPSQVEALLDQGVASGAFPGAVARWGRPDSPETICRGLRGSSRNRLPADCDLIYDLASLTKLLAATSLAMIAAGGGKLELKRPLAEGPLAGHFKSSPWNRIEPEHLLAHQSGLPAWRAFHRLPRGSAAQRKDLIIKALAATKPESRPARRTVYSDLNFIILGFLLEEVYGQNLKELFEKEVAGPLGLKKLGYRPRAYPLAPTEDGFRWGGPAGDRSGGFRGPVPLGRVHDDNAAYLGSVAGHAGLFGAAEDIWRLASEWPAALQNRSRVFTREIVEDFIKARPTDEDGGRPLGFNLLGRVESLKSSRLPASSLGHTGYTGPSLWWDPAGEFIWLLLCNRVHPRAVNPAWRPGLYQAGPTGRA